MSLLYIDGFDTYGTSNGSVPTANTVEGRWIAQNVASLDIEAPRGSSGQSLELNSTAQLLRPGLGTTNATLVAGAAIQVNGFQFSAHPVIWMKTGDTWGMNANIGWNGTIAVRRNTTTLNTSATGVITANTWHYIELKVVCGNSGSYELWVDGVSTLSGSGVDTQQHASKSYHDALALVNNSSLLTKYDDLYVLDGAGSTNNTNLGDVEVSLIRPDGDDTTDWTAQGGGDHYVEVDELVFDEDTTYIESGTATDQDIFTYGSLGSNGAIKGVQVTTDLRETAAESYQLKTLAKSAGNTVNVTAALGALDYISVSEMFEEDPDGANWSQSTVNATKFGVEVA